MKAKSSAEAIAGQSEAATMAEAVRRGEVGPAARLMRDLDDEIPGARDCLRALFPYTGRAHLIGITGAPGAGKSTLTDQLVAAYREQGKTVGVVAIDPSSPFGGGAILGDRIRMQRHSTDSGVFVRSLATRGHLGGLSRSTGDIVDVMDASGKDVIIIETVGVGQDELDVMRMAHTTVVIQVPGLGDDIQAIKAGILEIANVFVVNKADLDGADTLVRQLSAMLHARAPREGMPSPEIVKTDASRGSGIDQLVAAIDRHREMERAGAWAERENHRLERRFLEHLRDALYERGRARLVRMSCYDEFAKAVASRAVDPHSAAAEAASKILGEDREQRETRK
ncbi:MAG: methylmalonyl Co-A mutase-associated GTPase MeaB [Burkholderiales bacterium]|nr:methylmalonyl Co-A mutase-associated GTPase MeaB [Burkholderiales bacterium]